MTLSCRCASSKWLLRDSIRRRWSEEARDSLGGVALHAYDDVGVGVSRVMAMLA